MIPTVIVKEDTTFPATKMNTMTFNLPSLIKYVEYGLNELKEKNPITVIDVRVGVSGATVVYREKVKK